MNVSESTELLQCPYDKVHQVMRKRFQVHLLRCRRNHPMSEKVTCPFNVTHILNKLELNWHVTVCPERHAFERFKHAEREVEPVDSHIPPEEQERIRGDENWDDDPDVPTYDPSVYASNAPVRRMCQNAPKSVKKKFREEERMRLKALQNRPN